MSIESENLEKLRKLERITQDSPGDLITQNPPRDLVTRLIPQAYTLVITKQEELFALALLTHKGMKNKIIISEQESYKPAQELAKYYEKEAPEIGAWEVYINKQNNKVVK